MRFKSGAGLRKQYSLRSFVFCKNVAAINPNFHPNHPIRKVGNLTCKIDVGAKGLERHAAALDLFLTAHFCAPKTARNGDTRAQDIAIGHDLFYRLLQNATKSLALLQPSNRRSLPVSRESGLLQCQCGPPFWEAR